MKKCKKHHFSVAEVIKAQELDVPVYYKIYVLYCTECGKIEEHRLNKIGHRYIRDWNEA